MAVDDIVMRSARNGYLVLILVLLALSIYQFVTDGGFLAGGLWVVGVAVFYVSKYYYQRREVDPEADPQLQEDDETTAPADDA